MKSKVYFLPWDRKEELAPFLKKAQVFEHIKAKNFTALKIHFGEDGNNGYIKPEYVKQVVKIAREKTAFPFLIDASTLYSGQRSDAYHHLLIANKHGFNIDNCGCPIIIADGLRGNTDIAIEVNLKHCKKVFIASDIALADNYIFLSHFKGHEMTGFGGVLKNIGMGSGSKSGKYVMHDNSKPQINTDKCVACGVCVKWCNQRALEIKNGKISMDTNKCVGCGQCIVNCPNGVFNLEWSSGSESVQEKIVEYAAGVLKGKKSSSVNFLNHISKYCDCFAFTKNEPLMDDIGIVAGIDPVAVDQASYDIVNKAYGKNFFTYLYPDLNPEIQLEYAQEIGLGSRDYDLIKY
ncbi:MAG: DUF362 domain-containing protein [Elusimicrobiota bacterium]|jgi:uncharacterized Fe-S center protein|nr:DUF362 domain-containing protein [Elusimicrobiota bacterium]